MGDRSGNTREYRRIFGIVLSGKRYRSIFFIAILRDAMTKNRLHLTFFKFYLPQKSGICYTVTGIYATIGQNERRYVRGY